MAVLDVAPDGLPRVTAVGARGVRRGLTPLSGGLWGESPPDTRAGAVAGASASGATWLATPTGLWRAEGE